MNPTWTGAPRASLALPPHRGLNFPIRTFEIWKYLFFIGAHVPLGLLMFRSTTVATAHALLVGVAGLVLLFRSTHHGIANMAAYIAGAEVLWRMCSAGVFYEYGKYLASLFLVLALFRFAKAKRVSLPVFYFLLLTPAIVFTLDAFPFEVARRQISFNLSGPFSLMVSVVFFSGVAFSERQLRHFFVAFIGPLAGISICVIYTILTSAVEFDARSNVTTSGGFGPNQVSAVLGLGGVFAFYFVFLFFRGRRMGYHPFLKMAFYGLAAFFLTQCALTFSRGGMVLALANLLVGGFYFTRDPLLRQRFIVFGLSAGLIAFFLVLPNLQEFTGGSLGERYTDVSTTGRAEIARSEIEVWLENPILGVGPGMRRFNASEFLNSAAHTEYTRLLAEHGLLGILAGILLLIMGREALKCARDRRSKGLVAALLTWSLLFWLINGMRLYVPQMCFGLCFAKVLWQHTPRYRNQGIAPRLDTSWPQSQPQAF